MATGDLKNNLQKLRKELKTISYKEEVNLADMSVGKPTAFLPVYHYAFTSYNHALAEFISASNTELYSKTDFRFIEAVYKILRDMFHYKPLITKEQFFNTGFAERKIIMCSEVIHMIREKSRALNPQKKTATSGSAVSSLSQVRPAKDTRPKSAEQANDVQKSSSTSKRPRPKTATDHHVKIVSPPQEKAAPQVVNELLQPHKPQGCPVRHMTSHVPHPPITADLTSPPRVTKERLSAQSSSQYASEDIRFLPYTPSISKVKSAAVEVVSIPASKENSEKVDSSEEDDDDEIETVNAVTRGESFLEPQSTDVLESYEKTLQAVMERVNGLDIALKNVEAQAQNQGDNKVMTAITTIQQQVETLMARMVLVENRVALLEARVGDVCQNKPSGQDTKESHSAVLSQGFLDSRHRNPVSVSDSLDSHRGQTTSLPTYSTSGHTATQTSQVLRDSSPGQAAFSTYSPQGAQLSDVCQTNLSNGNAGAATNGLVQGSTPTLVSNSIHDSMAVGLSPIRKPKDFSNNHSINHSMTLPSFDVTNDDTFAAVTQDEKRLSSTPTKYPVMVETMEDSVSFHFGDISSQEKMLRIKEMIKETEQLLTKPATTKKDGSQ